MFFSMFEVLRGLFCLTGSYSNDVFPEPLSNKEEHLCIIKKMEGDIASRNKLIEHNLRLVAHIAKKFDSKLVSTDDLISIGTIGLIKGINSFSGDKGFKLSTYISRCIENEILMYFRNNKKTQNDTSINNIIGTDKDGNDMELIEIMEDDSQDLAEKIYTNMITKQTMDYINNKLTSREREIMYMRYGLSGGDEMTQQEVADLLKISRSYVSRIETKVQEKLKKHIKYEA